MGFKQIMRFPYIVVVVAVAGPTSSIKNARFIQSDVSVGDDVYIMLALLERALYTAYFLYSL